MIEHKSEMTSEDVQTLSLLLNLCPICTVLLIRDQ